ARGAPQGKMKPRLQTSLGQQLVLTPQLRQALHLLQLSALELEAEINTAVESNPLLDWDESEPLRVTDGSGEAPATGDDEVKDAGFREDDWSPAGEAWQESRGWSGDDDGDAAERVVQTDSLQDHLSWQLHLTQMSERDRRIGLMLIDAIDDDGYLREPLDAIAQSLLPEIQCTADEVLSVLHRVQRLDPVGVGARDLGECLVLQLDNPPDHTPARVLARRIALDHTARLPRIGIEGVAAQLG